MKQFLIIAALVATGAWAHIPVAAPDHTVPRVHMPRVPRGKLLRSNPHRLITIRLQGTDPYDAPDDDYICTSSARRPRIAKPTNQPDDEVSGYVQVRLAVARARAMQKYREIHA